MMAENREILLADSDVSGLKSLMLPVDFSQCHFHFQPIFSLRDNTIKMYEALLRVDNSQFNNIEDFVVHLISGRKEDQLTLLTLNSVKPYLLCDDYNDIVFTINLEPAQIGSKRFVALVNYFFSHYKICKSRVLFEITERPCSLSIFSALVSNANKLTKLGFSFAIDDFGTGVSNFEMLGSISVKLLKLDGSFGLNALSNPNYKKILSVASSFKAAFGCSVCVEGLETEEHVALAKTLGFCYGQGYALGKPSKLKLI